MRKKVKKNKRKIELAKKERKKEKERTKKRREREKKRKETKLFGVDWKKRKIEQPNPQAPFYFCFFK